MTKYIGNGPMHNDSPPVTGILITNLGTPDAPTTSAVRKYLAEFLSDSRVIEFPKIFWMPVLYGIILVTRPRRSAQAYAKIWTDSGSPLRIISEKQVNALRKNLEDKFQSPFAIELAMRYGNPSISSALEKLRSVNIRRLLLFPLYPQYSATTTASTFDAVTKVLKSWRWLPEFRYINHYHDDRGYITALAESVRTNRANTAKPEKLLFSFHGLPKKYFASGDPYFCECQKTARLVAEQLELNNEQWAVSFQSRLGPTEWLKPYTDEVLQQWAQSGLTNVQVICPGFSADCLETLEEIQLQYRQVFLDSGGKHFSYIPALNDGPDHIDVLTNIILEHSHGWTDKPNDDQLSFTKQQAEKLMGQQEDL